MIGVFDSGVGGLSIYAEIKKLFPQTKVIYLADSANFPYGEKNAEELFMLCDKNVRQLSDKGAKIVVIACNSATVSTINRLRAKWDLPMVGIEPALKVASSISKNGRIGVIATKGTINNHNSKDLISSNQILIKEHSSELVEKVEHEYDQISDKFLKDTLGGLAARDVDTVVLGCTHFFFLKDRLNTIFPEINFISPDIAVAKRVAEVMSEKQFELAVGEDEFIVTGDKSEFEKAFDGIFGHKVKVN